MPNISLSGEQVNYPIQDLFVTLELEDRGLYGISANPTTLRIDGIFQSEREEGVRPHRYILIVGKTGSGKTTIAKKLCYDWATLESPNYVYRFEGVANISLKDIGRKPITECVLEEIEMRSSLPNGMKILVILDGCSEIEEKDNLINFLNSDELVLKWFSRKSCVVVTSRPFAVENLPDLFDRVITISGLSTENQWLYIKTILPGSEGECLIEEMKRNDLLTVLSQSPLLLHCLCVLRKRFPSPGFSRVDFSQILWLLTRYCSKQNALFEELLISWQYLFLDHEIFDNLGWLATKYLMFGEYINEETLQEMLQEEYDFDFVLGLGFIVPVASSDISKWNFVGDFQFFHRNIALWVAFIYFVKVVRTVPSITYLLYFDEMIEYIPLIFKTDHDIKRSKVMLEWYLRNTLKFIDSLMKKKMFKSYSFFGFSKMKALSLSELQSLMAEITSDIYLCSASFRRVGEKFLSAFGLH